MGQNTAASSDTAAAQSDSNVRRRPEQERSRAGVEAILNATAALLDDHSIDQVTVTEIARGAQCSKAAVYRYFPTKTAIVRELAKRQFAAQQGIIANQLDTDEAPEDLLVAGMRTYLLSHRDEPFRAQLRAIIRADPELTQLDIADSRTNAETIRSHLVSTGHPDDGDLATRLLLILEMTDSVVRLVSVVDHAEGDRLVEQFCQLARDHIFG